jgi:FdhD protein
VTIVDGGVVRRQREQLATEEPLEVRVAGPSQATVAVSVTMRTPGSDFELAAGFLHTEGLIRSYEEISQIRYCDDVESEDQRFNVVTVHLRSAFDATPLARNQFMTSSCGVCGKASIDQVTVACRPIASELVVPASVIASLPETLRASQATFAVTGGLHATGLFDAGGALRTLREDVGRHNAMDKAIGERFLAGAGPLGELVAFVSGRSSFELVQKAAVAGIPVLAAVGAPSSLAVDAADRLGVTLVGWVRDGRLTIYTHPRRVAVDA